nr:PREDICTED: cubilin [Tribolium castaneum]|eukprot:XP_008192422.1 PREDICTED: cubilin [Tribolium castaneum]
MILLYFVFSCFYNFVFGVNYFGPQPRIVTQDGHLIFYAAVHKNISLQTQGRGKIHVNGIDLSQAAKLTNSAFDAMKKYQTNFENTFEKISKFEQLLDDGLMQKITTLNGRTNGTTQDGVNSASLVRSVRRLNRRVNALQKSVKMLADLLEDDDCQSDPCKNGGTCEDLFNTFLCHCPPEWEGPVCDKDVNECARFAGTDLGCQNGATCVNRPGSYECLCSRGWVGLHCRNRNVDCRQGSNFELCGHGTCITQYNDVGYKCICDEGWTTDGKTPACNTDVNECTGTKPHCSVNPPVQCINLPGTYRCGSCPAGYTGDGYYCTDIDECSTSNGGCSTNPMVQCINTLGSRFCGSCPSGYVGDGITCSYQGVCNVNNGGCHPLATCRNNPRIGSTFVECICPSDYTGNGIGRNGCVRSLPSAPGPCTPNPCRRGFCRVTNGTDYTCHCNRRYAGKNCEKFRDLCTSNPCQNGATCTSFLGISYQCLCPSAYTGLRCETEKQSCGGRLVGETGTLVFPSGSSQTYSSAMSCAWILETNVTKVLNITFKRFDVEGSRGCRYDWLQIHDGKNTLARSLGRFCGHQLPNGGNIVSTHNTVYLWFRSDHSVASEGFELNWTSIVPFCGDQLKSVTSHGIIQSPGSPGNYPNNRDCYWPLQAQPGKRLLFHFFTLMIGNNSACDHDYLEFISGTEPTDPVFAKFCNTTHPSPLFSPSGEVLVHFHSDMDKNYPGFQITYSVVEGMPGCGGVYTRSQDEIRSPMYNGNYPNDIQCEYKIQLTTKSRIKLTFLSFDVEDSENCQFDYVAIYAGTTVDAPLIGKYCGQTVPSPYITEKSEILIVFKTDWATAGEGFALRYETVCGGTFTTPSGVIQSPGYPKNYDHNLECIFEIVQPLGNIIKLNIVDLDLESNTYPDCVYDFLEVRDGHNSNSTLIGTYCANKVPLIVSSYNYLWIKFQSDTNNNGKGFRANYTTTNIGCGGIMKEKSGTFSTPKYPQVYPSGTICKWIISAPPGNVIQVTWMNFQIEGSFDCTYDAVEIFDNNTETGEGTSIGKFCGQHVPPAMLSTSNLITVIFHSDQTNNMNGFVASYSTLLESTVCRGNYYSNAGVIKSPGYPNNYPLNIECTWTIQVKPGHQILLNVTDFQLEHYTTCRYDWLEIRNGGSSMSPLLGRFCNTDIPKMIPSHANKLFIRFKSDMSKSEKGFKITWEATATGCGGVLNSPTGSIISPNYPEPYNLNAECIWKISISAGSLIQLVFSDLDLEEHSECALDYVEILDGPSLNSKSLGRFCLHHPSFLRSSGNTLTVIFRSDLSRNGRGFHLQYITMCNNTLKGFRGVIESPNFPNNYPNSVNCNWEIKVADKNKINISFSHFDLEKVLVQNVPSNNSDSDKCLFDYVEVLYVEPVEEYEEEGPFQKYGIYCGDKIPPLITLNSDHAKIRFLSDNLLFGNGFRLEWQLEGCGDILTHPNGTIFSPNYPRSYPPSIECNWKIQVDFGSNVEITFHKIEIEKTYICHLDYIKLYNGEDETYPEIATLCHQNKPITLRSSGNFLFVKFKADSSVQGMGFYANYTSTPTKCGGKYTADSAFIMSPNYPENYNKNSTCGYEIQVGEGFRIELKFQDFDLYAPNRLNCTSNNISYVKIYDGPTIDFPLLAKICNKNAPNKTILTTTNQMYIEMVSQTDMASKGFLAKYEKACGARIVTSGTGHIRIFSHDLDYDESNCTWTIIAKDLTKHITLTVLYLDSLNGYCDENIKILKVYNGESSEAPLLGEYCQKIPPTLTSDGSAMHVVVDSNTVLYATYSVFDSVCGGTLTSVAGYFASPGYPKKYPVDTECEWTIDVTEGNHVSLSFSYFGLVESDHCNTDYLEIRQNNGTGKLLGTFCGSDLPTNITNEGNLWIFLKTSRSDGQVKGFYAEYVLNHENELSGPRGRIVSPLYYQNYPFYGDFSWTITVAFGKRILLTFKDILLENGDSMCFSSIYIYDGSTDEAPSLGEFCGSTLPDAIKTSSNIVLIKFSGYSTSRSLTKFIIEWLEIESVVNTNKPSPKPNGCGTKEPIALNELKNYTTITSPGFPNGYAPNLQCEWILTTIPMNSLRIYFREMDLQPTYGGCYADYVEIFEKRLDKDWTSVLKTCLSNITSNPGIYTTNMMKVVFKSDRYGNKTGFSALVRESCGGTLTAPTDYIIYNNNSRSSYLRTYNSVCQWNITVRSGRTIELEFLYFNIHHDTNKGCDNYLIIRNGKFPDSPILGTGKYCGDQKPPTLKTTGNNAYIKFGGITSLSNFIIRYREISYACDSEIKLTKFANSTEIHSPNYPNIPPPHVECNWRIMAPPGETLRIDFIDRFDLKVAKNCTHEYVEVRDGGTKYSKIIGKYCEKPNSQFSTDNMMFVRFFTELNDPSNGFKARIVLANCGGSIHSTTGQIQSPFFNIPSKYPVGVNCTWHLISPQNHNMDITFEKIDLEEALNCTGVDHVKIYERNEFDNKEYVLGNFCGKKLPAMVQSSGSEAIVHFETGKIKKELGGFSLKFNASAEVCGGSIEASEGTIKSPGYPNPHKIYRRCSWNIKVPKGRRVTLKIEDFGLDNRFKGSWINGLVIYHDEKFKGYIRKISASNEIVESSENHMLVFYWSPATMGRGFKAKFTSNNPSVCDGDFNQDSGTITQPNIDYTYSCTYVRDKPSNAGTLALTLTTTTNTTIPSNVKNCLTYIAAFKIETVNGKKELFSTNCVPGTSVVRIPHSKIQLSVVQYSSRNQVNFTLSYNTYQCGGIITRQTGEITSPGYPNKNSKSMECSWLLQLPKEQTISLTFDSLNLGSNCEKSYIDIYNGDSPKSPKIDRYCQSNKPGTISSQTNNLWIDYKFDIDSDSKGFSLKYEPKIQGCGGIFHDRESIIQTPSFPNDYPNNAECLWELRSVEGFHIGLIFTTRFQIEETDNCENDFLEIWDWRDDDWVSLGRKCGREFPKTVNSTSNRMKILFRSNERITGKGFRAQWQWNCGGTFTADRKERFIVSPGFPQEYQKNIDCQYNITSKQSHGRFINIKFYNFDLEGSGSNCRYDNLTLSRFWMRKVNYYHMPATQVFCGQKLPPPIRLGDTLYIRFQTDPWVQKTGFKFSYQLDDCGGQITSPTVISSPLTKIDRSMFPLYTGYMSCIWNITAPPKKSIVISFQKFRFEYRIRCHFDHVQIIEGPVNTIAKRIANLCGDLNQNLPTIKSENNTVLVVMNVDRSQNHEGFEAEVYFVDGPEAGCGGKIVLNKTMTLEAPNLADMDCLWTIQSQIDTTVKIHFDELNLPSRCGLTNHTITNCSCAALEVRDGHPGVGDLIERFCGITDTHYSREITTSGNVMGLRLRTRGSNSKAFKVTLTPIASICGPVYLNVTQDVKTLLSPNYPNKYPSDLRCSWILKGTSRFVVRFIDFDLNKERNQHVVNNVCGEDKLEIVDNMVNLLTTSDMGPSFTVSGDRKLTTDFLRYGYLTGTHQFCGRFENPFDFYSQFSQLIIKFKSGNLDKDRGKGFKIEYHTTGCNRNFTSLQGRIVQNDRTQSKSCIQIITVPKNYTISLYFQELTIFHSEGCQNAGIEIRDENSQGTLFQKVCGYYVPNPVFSTKNQLWIRSWNTNSFPISYDLVYTASDQGRGCGGIIYNYKGTFSSPLHPMAYKNSTPCVWTLRTAIGRRIAIKFTVFDIQGDCAENYVKVTTYEKNTSNDHKYCKNDDPAVLYSNSRMLVTYQSSTKNDGSGWIAKFEAASS